MKESEKRDVNISCRITKSVEAIINSYDGDSIGDKICNMARIVEKMNTRGILEDRMKLMREIENLNEAVQLVNRLCENLTEMNKRYTQELLEKDRQLIAANIREEGFFPNDSIVDKVIRLNELTGGENTVNKIYEMYSSGEYLNDEVKENVEALAEEFRRQELERDIQPETGN